MRAFAVFLAVCLLAGCASKPDYYISPAPVTKIVYEQSGSADHECV